MISRRQLLQSSLGAALLGSWSPARAQTMSSQALNPNLALISGNGGNILVRKAANGELLAVDGGLAANATRLLDSIRATLGSERITTLMNTHWHHEHVGLNASLGARGVRI